MERFTVRYVRGFAFAFNEKGQNAYVPFSLATEHELQVGGTFMGLPMLNHNEEQREDTPFVIVVIEGGAVKNAGTIADRDEMVFDAICNIDVATTATLAAETGLADKTVNNSANRLFEAGRISQAKVYTRPEQERASIVLWGKNLQSFTRLG